MASAVAGGKIGWEFRAATLADAELLDSWIAADPRHAGRITAEQWLRPADAEGKPLRGFENLAAVDAAGTLLFLRCKNAMRIDIQFAPGVEEKAAGRTARALFTGVPTMAALARERGYREMIFESQSERLIAFLTRMGFKASANEYILHI